MAQIVDGEAVLSHSAQELDDNVDEVVEARGEYESLAEAIEAAGGSYTLPIASASTLGGVKVGSGLSIDGNGVLSASGGGGGGTYSETELLSAPVVGNRASDISPIPLLDSIDNYNQLVFRFGIFDGQNEQCFVQTILCSDLTNNVIFSLIGYPRSDYNLLYGIIMNTSTSLTVTNVVKNGWPESATIFSIKGIKY